MLLRLRESVVARQRSAAQRHKSPLILCTVVFYAHRVFNSSQDKARAIKRGPTDIQCRKISAFAQISRVVKQILAIWVFSRLKAHRSLLLLEQRNGRVAFKKPQATQKFTFEKASLQERQRESSHFGIKSTHIILVKDKKPLTDGETVRAAFTGGCRLPVWEIF